MFRTFSDVFDCLWAVFCRLGGIFRRRWLTTFGGSLFRAVSTVIASNVDGEIDASKVLLQARSVGDVTGPTHLTEGSPFLKLKRRKKN